MQLEYSINYDFTVYRLIKSMIMDNRTISNSSIIHNRSFLHGNGIIDYKDTKLEGLALKRKSLPLQLISTDIIAIENFNDIAENVEITRNVSSSAEEFDLKVSTTAEEEVKNGDINKDKEVIEVKGKENMREVDKGVSTIQAKFDDLANKEDTDTEDSWEKLDINVENSNDKIIENSRDNSNENKKLQITNINFKVKPKWGFTRTVMHYVPNRSKKSRKLSRARLKKLTTNKENKSLSVSKPTNFTYLAGTAKWSWLNDASLNSHSGPVITHEEKFATLSMIGEDNIKEIDENKSMKVVNNSDKIMENNSKDCDESCMRPRANYSFLWSNLSKRTVETKAQCEDEENYDDVGVSVDQENQDDVYDDVGPPSTSDTALSTAIDYDDDDQVYDDVMPPSNPLSTKCSDTDVNCGEKEKKTIKKSNDHEEDDLIYMANDYSSVDEDADDDDTLYDDVGVKYQSRVNSLYAGSNIVSQVESSYGKESEWEDLEESLTDVVLRNNQEGHSTPSKKKTNRKSRKLRRQRSKTLRKSTSRASSRAARISRQSAVSVAVSLGTGSVLLVGTPDTTPGGANTNNTWRNITEENTSINNSQTTLRLNENDKIATKTQGLVQLRTVERDEATVDTQETSCYVLEDTASDDSNYETLCTEPYETSIVETSIDNNSMDIPKIQVAPSRPVPPPPRESSITETFGRQIKMLRRTWSITKGSIGRMRRKTFTNNEIYCNDDNESKSTFSENYHSERKTSQTFNFIKHFQKNVSGYSTFYLDNVNDIKGKNNNYSIDDIYGNKDWLGDNDWQSDSIKAQGNNSDDYNMLSEEPLYQFYAAATVRGAFQSDSDSNYGEDDSSSMSLPSTSDLGKPGHRTLWCETPQVMNSQLLETLTPDEKKIQEAKFEILTSEASYLNSLRVLVSEFLINHELVYEALSPTDREKLFGRVPSVLIASEKFLAELESTWRLDPMLRGLPEVVLNHAERCSKIYIDYCSNQVSIDSTLKELKSRKTKFLETVTKIESHPACQCLSLHSFLMLPMQRVTRLPLLADAVLSKLSTEHEERLDWERVVSVLGKVVTDCNEGARTAGRLIEMEMLSRKLVYSTKVSPIDLRDRHLVRSGQVTQIMAKQGSEYVLTFRKKYQKSALCLLLLTDYILVAKLKANANQEESYTVIDGAKRSLIQLEKVPDDSPFAGRHAMILTLLENSNKRHVEYILSCHNETERERWLDAVSPPKSNSVGETLYETWDCPQVMALYSYAPSQPDELSLQPGDVINVLRKMSDGWNHGEKLVGGEQGWFPGNFVKEVASEHVRARNLRQRHRFIALSESLLQQHVKQQSVAPNR